MTFPTSPSGWVQRTYDIAMSSGDIESLRVDLVFERAQGTVQWDEVSAVANPAGEPVPAPLPPLFRLSFFVSSGARPMC